MLKWYVLNNFRTAPVFHCCCYYCYCEYGSSFRCSTSWISLSGMSISPGENYQSVNFTRWKLPKRQFHPVKITKASITPGENYQSVDFTRWNQHIAHFTRWVIQYLAPNFTSGIFFNSSRCFTLIDAHFTRCVIQYVAPNYHVRNICQLTMFRAHRSISF